MTQCFVKKKKKKSLKKKRKQKQEPEIDERDTLHIFQDGKIEELISCSFATRQSRGAFRFCKEHQQHRAEVTRLLLFSPPLRPSPSNLRYQRPKKRVNGNGVDSRKPEEEDVVRKVKVTFDLRNRKSAWTSVTDKFPGTTGSGLIPK